MESTSLKTLMSVLLLKPWMTKLFCISAFPCFSSRFQALSWGTSHLKHKKGQLCSASCHWKWVSVLFLQHSGIENCRGTVAKLIPRHPQQFSAFSVFWFPMRRRKRRTNGEKEFSKWYSQTRVHLQAFSKVHADIKDLVLINLLSVHLHSFCTLRGQAESQVAKWS